MSKELLINLKGNLLKTYQERLEECNGDILDGGLVVYRSILGLIDHNVKNETTEGMLGVLEHQLEGMKQVQDTYKSMGIETSDTGTMLSAIKEIQEEIDKLT